MSDDRAPFVDVELDQLEAEDSSPNRSHLDYADEAFVRAYKRTSSRFWMLGSDLPPSMEWWPREIWWDYLRHLDELGRMIVGRPQDLGLALELRIPREVARVCLVTWIRHGLVVLIGEVKDQLYTPEFFRAQYTRQNDKTRKKAQRTREHAVLEAKRLGLPVPPELEDEIGDADDDEADVTSRHQARPTGARGDRSSPDVTSRARATSASASASASASRDPGSSIKRDPGGGGGRRPPPHLPRHSKAKKVSRKKGTNPRAQGTDLRSRHRAPRDVGDNPRTEKRWAEAARLGVRPHELAAAKRAAPSDTDKQFREFVKDLERKALNKGGA